MYKVLTLIAVWITAVSTATIAISSINVTATARRWYQSYMEKGVAWKTKDGTTVWSTRRQKREQKNRGRK